MNDKRILRDFCIMIVLGLLLGLVALGFVYHRDCKGRFLKSTRINGVNVAGMTAEQAETAVTKNYSLKVLFREGKRETLKGTAIDYELEEPAIIAERLKKQSFGDYLSSLYLHGQRAMTLRGKYSEKKLRKAVMKWPEMQKKNMKKPKSARVAYENGKFFVVKPSKGTVVNKDSVLEAVEKAVSVSMTGLNLSRGSGYYKDKAPAVSEKQLKEDCRQLSGMSWSSVTYELPDGSKKVLDANQMKDWLVRGEDGRLKRDDVVWEQKLTAFVARLANSVDTVDRSHRFKTHSGKVIRLQARGYYGWRIDREGEAARLAKDLKKGADVERKPVYAQTEAAPYSENYGFGNTYVEVNLSAQHLWMYKDGRVVFQTDVVSGTRGVHETPAGAYFLLAKARNVVLRGPSKTTTEKKGKKTVTKTSYEWESPVSYWMPINYEGVGMHDANWRGVFGGSIWAYNGSHGCINLPPSKAARLYSLVHVGIPVAVYY